MFILKLITLIICFNQTFSHDVPHPDDEVCQGKGDFYYVDPADPCSCWCLNQKVNCPTCYDPTTNDMYPYCMDKEDHQINPSDPCSCWCINEEIVCGDCVTYPPTTTEDFCGGNTDYPIDPTDPLSCWCKDGSFICPTSIPTDLTTEAFLEMN